MRLYQGSLNQFKDDVIKNKIADLISSKYFSYYGRNVSPSERNSWNISLNFMKNALDYSNLKDNRIVIEFELPYSSRRIDVILFGKNDKYEDNIILIELKQWSNENILDCETEGNIIVNYGKFVKEQAHPSLQVEGYHYGLKDFMYIFENPPVPDLSSCAYCHNYSKLKQNNVLYAPKFKRLIETFPLFSKEDMKSLGEYLQQRLQNGCGLEVFNRFIHCPIKPSKKLLDHTRKMINTQQIFTLIDDQISAYNTIMHKAKNLAKLKTKCVIIVKGGPGTGKSVIALETMGELLRDGKVVYHATGSSAFTNTLRKILGTRSSNLFKFFNSFMGSKENEIDILICDEAHRIRETSVNRYTPKKTRTNTPQVEELLKVAKLSVFFIDEHQVVRPNEIGSVNLIKNTAIKMGVKNSEIFEFELKTQFRCNGSDSFLQWVENMLDIRESEKVFLTSKDRMEFKIFDDPVKLKMAIDRKNQKKKNCARLVAGFCWPWSKPNHDGSLINDVKVGNLEMPWEKKDQFWKWATDDSGMDQVGTVYTAQGFEFDYIGIIFGKDLVHDNDKNQWIAHKENSYDNMAKINNNEFAKHLKNVYRVLMSRAHLGCYVYFCDKETEAYFKKHIKFDHAEISLLESSDIIFRKDSKEIQIEELVDNSLKFEDYLPAYSLKAACGYFGEGQDVEPEGWIKVSGIGNLNRNMFICKAIGRSMEPKIKDGSYCIFRTNIIGSRNNKIVLVQHNNAEDPESGGKYSIKKYKSKKKFDEDGSWSHEQIILEPLNNEFKPIIIDNADEGEFIVIAELITTI